MRGKCDTTTARAFTSGRGKEAKQETREEGSRVKLWRRSLGQK